MQLESRVYFKSSESMSGVAAGSADLIVTSPPYPMVEMWDGIFPDEQGAIDKALHNGDGPGAWEEMHSFLDRVWGECFRLLKDGGFACINIGDATRTIGGSFRLYPNHARVTSAMQKLGFDCLPAVHWFKPTNSPNKFMGSGMLPSGAYVTLEHEYILIFRKGPKRIFTDEEKKIRRRSAVFWEERNRWFSDVWDLRGERQQFESGRQGRERSGAFPLELPYRLINMYSMQGDTVVDPFLGTGTSLTAAVLNGRRCIGFEIDAGLNETVASGCIKALESAKAITSGRLERHNDFIGEYGSRKKPPGYINSYYGFGVVTSQEQAIILPELSDVRIKDGGNTLSVFHDYDQN